MYTYIYLYILGTEKRSEKLAPAAIEMTAKLEHDTYTRFRAIGRE